MGSGTATPVSPVVATTFICPQAEIYTFLGIDSAGIFTVDAANDVLVLTSDEGAANIDIPDGTYSAADLATALQTVMNNDDTLTGTRTITFVVTYSTATNKFTLNAGTNHEIAYTHADSDAGLMMGFTEDATAAETITSNTGVDGDPPDVVDDIHIAIEKDFRQLTRRDIVETTYTNERYDGHGDREQWLDNYPITDLKRLSVSLEEVIGIKNTATTYTEAKVEVDSNSLDLSIDQATPSALAFSAYATITLMVDAINAQGSGWVAELTNSNFAEYKSSNLVPQTLMMNSWDGTVMDNQGLFMAGQPVSPAYIDADAGLLQGWFPRGNKNVTVTYVAGYTDSTMPENYKIAIQAWVQSVWRRRNEEGFDLKGFTTGAVRVEYGDLPKVTQDAISAAKRVI